MRGAGLKSIKQSQVCLCTKTGAVEARTFSPRGGIEGGCEPSFFLYLHSCEFLTSVIYLRLSYLSFSWLVPSRFVTMRSLLSISSFSGIPLVLLLSSRLTAAAGYQQCYYPDGSIPTDYIWTPCTGEEFSSCCIPSEGDVCQPNGLCWFPPFGEVFRGACTDRTWNSPACPKDICVDGNVIFLI